MFTLVWLSGIWYQHIHVICSSVDTAITWSNGINHWQTFNFRCKGYTAIGTLFLLVKVVAGCRVKSYGLLLNAEEWSLRNSGVSIKTVATQNLYGNMEIWKWNCNSEVTPVRYAFFNKLSCRRAILESVLLILVQLVKRSLHFCRIWGFSAISMIDLYWSLSSARLIHFTFSP